MCSSDALRLRPPAGLNISDLVDGGFLWLQCHQCGQWRAELRATAEQCQGFTCAHSAEPAFRRCGAPGEGNAVFLRVAKAEGLQVLVPSRLCAVADRGVGVMVMGFEIVEVAAPPREGGGGPATVFVIQRDGRTLLADRPGFDCPEEAALVAARIKKRYPPAELDKEEVMQALHAGPPAPALGLA